jgi:hypothetical protein
MRLFFNPRWIFHSFIPTEMYLCPHKGVTVNLK